MEDTPPLEIAEAVIKKCDNNTAICKIITGKETIKSNLDGGVKLKLISTGKN